MMHQPKYPDPNTTALLVLWPQKFFYPTYEPILSNLLKTIRCCRDLLMPIFFVRLCQQSIGNNSMLCNWWGGHVILTDSIQAELIPEIEALKTDADTILDTNCYNAFTNTILNSDLQRRGVNTVIICGAMTHLSCSVTALEAYNLNYRVFFSSDATSTINENLQNNTLLALLDNMYSIDCQMLRFLMPDTQNMETTD